jgi:hypothetical protein
MGSQSCFTTIKLDFEPVLSDYVMLVNQFRIMRLKMPTIDLLYLERKLTALENKAIFYKMDLVKSEDEKTIKFVRTEYIF